MEIQNFKKGDKITRIEPSEGIGDRSYIGTKFRLIAVANGCVYVEALEDKGMRMIKSGKRILPLDWFSKGWDYYEDISKLSFIDIFKSEIKKALEDENYELLSEIKNILNII